MVVVLQSELCQRSLGVRGGGVRGGEGGGEAADAASDDEVMPRRGWTSWCGCLARRRRAAPQARVDRRRSVGRRSRRVQIHT